MSHPARLTSPRSPSPRAWAILALFFSLTQALASVNEAEPNSRVGGSTLVSSSPTERRTMEVDTQGEVDPTANGDPSQANALPAHDEMIGQLGSTRDYDWFYLDVPDSARPVTPVYFGCDRAQTYHFESPDPFTVADPAQDLSWQIDYYYDADPHAPGGVTRQSRYLVPWSACQKTNGETKGPFRFQMNTARPGRYYVRVWGRLVERNRKITDQIKVAGPPDQNGHPTVETVDRDSYYDLLVAPNADYSIRPYTGRVAGELEPNDGLVEAYGLVSGRAVTTQLASLRDQDWFSIDNDLGSNPSGKITFYFHCQGQSASYLLSSYDSLGVLQGAYDIKSDQCSGAAGFGFTLNAPESRRYYVVVASSATPSGAFSQADYSVLAIAGPPADTPTPTRKEGEFEPNDTAADAFPLQPDRVVKGQLASMGDLDFYAYDADGRSNHRPLYFRCPGANPAALYQLSVFDSGGQLQANYSVGSVQCAVPGGYVLDINTPTASRYYVRVSGPNDGDPGQVSDGDYTLSPFYDAAGEVPNTASGTLRSLTLVDRGAANQDTVSLNLGPCGGAKGGSLKVTGKKLNFPTLDENAQVQLRIGSWSCTSAPTLLYRDRKAAQTTVRYPAPAASTPAATPAPTTNITPEAPPEILPYFR
jgi:hypothetical protein